MLAYSHCEGLCFAVSYAKCGEAGMGLQPHSICQHKLLCCYQNYRMSLLLVLFVTEVVAVVAVVVVVAAVVAVAA